MKQETNSRFKAVHVMKHLRFFTQNGILSPKEASILVDRYIQTGDGNKLLSALSEAECPDTLEAVKQLYITNITEVVA